jgi:DNA-binding CsgD family transcriptional regulator
MWDKKDSLPLGKSKVIINPSYEWDEDVKPLNVSHRELEVFALLMDGHDNKEIAQILGLQYQSVKNHIFSLYKKLKAKNMAQAMKMLLFGNFIKVEVPGVDWLKFDKDKWIEHTKWVLDSNDTHVSASDRKETKKFLMEHGLYGKLYDDKLREIRKGNNDET